MSGQVRAGYKLTEAGVIPNSWEAHPLGQVIRLQRGYDLPHRRRNLGAVPIISSSGNCGYHDESQVKGPGVVTGRYGTIGEVYFVQEDFWPLNTTLFVKDFYGADPLFISYLLRTIDFHSHSGKSGVPGVNRNDLHELVVAHPPVDEQRVIASALSDIDTLISGLDQLIAKKRDIQQAAMQQLLTGQRRLPGFSGEWEVKRLDDYGRCLRGVSYKGDADLLPHDTDESYRLLRSNNVQNGRIDVNGLQFVKAGCVSAQQVMRHDDILICMANGSKELVGKAAIFSVSDGFSYTFGAFMGCFRANPNAVPRFIYFLLNSGRYRNYIANLLAGSSINNLRPTHVEQMEFPFPSADEQIAIANVLSDMDTEIASLEARRDKALLLKQGMMQELLTGHIRIA